MLFLINLSFLTLPANIIYIVYCPRSVFIFCFIVATINCCDETEALVPLTLWEEKLKGKKIQGVKTLQGFISLPRYTLGARHYICILFFSLIFDILWSDGRAKKRKKDWKHTYFNWVLRFVEIGIHFSVLGIIVSIVEGRCICFSWLKRERWINVMDIIVFFFAVTGNYPLAFQPTTYTHLANNCFW